MVELTIMVCLIAMLVTCNRHYKKPLHKNKHSSSEEIILQIDKMTENNETTPTEINQTENFES